MERTGTGGGSHGERRRGVSLLEVVFGIAFLAVLLVPVIRALVSSKAETVAARDHLLAMSVAQAILADLRASGREITGPEETAVADLPMFRAILDLHRQRSPGDASAIKAGLASFRTRIRPAASGGHGVEITVEWTEAGTPKTLVLQGGPRP